MLGERNTVDSKVRQIDFTMLLQLELYKHRGQVLTDQIIWHLVMDIQHRVDIYLINFLQR
jgi:hypothetical protein